MALSPTGSGILDHHVLMALVQGWKTFSADFDKFALLFPGDIKASVVNQWWKELTSVQQERRLDFRVHGSRGVNAYPSVVVKLENESLENNPLGEITHFTEKTPIHQMLLRQQVLVEVVSMSPESTRALCVVVRAILQCAKKHFIRAKYRDFAFQSAEGLSPEEQLIAEQMGMAGICVRRMHYSALAHVDIPDVFEQGQDIDWFAWRDDIVDVAGHKGGVLPYGG